MTNYPESRYTLQHLQALAARNPATLLVDASNNSRVIRTTIARMSFANVGTPRKNDKDPTKPPKHGTNLLFLPGTDFSVPAGERLRLLAEKYPGNPQGVGMKPAIRDQAEWISPADGGRNVQGKSYKGFVPGAGVMLPTANRQPTLWVPPVVNGEGTRFVGTPAEIDAAFYSGCWVIAFLNVYQSKAAENPGVFFGLEGLFKVADDEKLGGESGAAAAMRSPGAFAGISVDNNTDPTSFF